MNNNDILRRTRYILDLKDNQITKIFKHVDVEVTEQQVNLWLKREEDAGFEPLPDETLIDFLDALIIERRGKKDGPSVRFKQNLDNNLILMKMKIAFHLKAEEALAIMDLADFRISKHEFSALFRKKDHKHYRVCKNQMLRKFMKGLQIKYRGQNNKTIKTEIKDVEPSEKAGQLSLKSKPTTQPIKTDSKKPADKPTDKPADKQITENTKSEADKTEAKKPAPNVWKIPKKK